MAELVLLRSCFSIECDLTASTMLDDENTHGGHSRTSFRPPQSTTTGKTNWYWDATGYNLSASSLFFDLFIPKFEYTSIEEVDPVDA